MHNFTLNLNGFFSAFYFLLSRNFFWQDAELPYGLQLVDTPGMIDLLEP